MDWLEYIEEVFDSPLSLCSGAASAKGLLAMTDNEEQTMTETLEKTETETKTFAAETARVLNLMIHALYTNRDIFLRELISNASDACDKLRYEALTNESLLGDAPELSIHLTFDEKAKTLTITDTGIGMNREDLIANLGTIAKSGTKEFLESMSGDEAPDVNLIGQFGVGFYSGFMVADKMTVTSRKAGEDAAWQWESDGQGSYTVKAADAKPRGTTITLHMKKDAKEYLDRHRLGHIVSTYSDHIGFPITLTDSEGVNHTLNEGGAIWTRPKGEVTDEQHQEFYRHVSHSPEKPWAVMHTKAEGKVEYTSLLYVPGIKPFDLFHPERRARVKLYVKRVFITDEGVELVPPYLRFLRGVVDSADLPLNISRETLQKSPMLDKIRESVTSRVLTDLKKRAEKDPADYVKFWDNFGAALKEGLCEANSPREKILDACRFYSTNCHPELVPGSPSVSDTTQGDPGIAKANRDDVLTSLADYKSRMREGQEAIYFLTGDSLAMLKASPQLEGFTKRGIEVLLLTDHVDDFWPNVTQKYGDLPFRSVTKAGADLDKFPLEGEENNAEEAAENSEDTKKLCEAMQALFGDAVSEVRTTRKLADTPICLGVAEGAMDMRMERFLADHKQLPKRAAKLLEINPTHPVITQLAGQVAKGGMNDQASDALWLLFDQALIAEGEPVVDAAAFARRLGALLGKGLAA
jgi:molecular chaperone HtpG